MKHRIANMIAHVRAFPPWAYNSWAGMFTDKFGPANDNQSFFYLSGSGMPPARDTAYLIWNTPRHLIRKPITTGDRWDLAWEEPL